MSFWDARVMSFLYPQNDWRLVSASRSKLFQDGSFILPYDEFEEGLDHTPAHGTLWLDSGTDSTPHGILTEPMLIEASCESILIE